MKLERDPYTGQMTTGHEWNGIKELNTRVPWPVYFFLALAAAFSVVYWILMPAWPLGRTHTEGLLGIDQRGTVARQLQAATVDRATWSRSIMESDYKTILTNGFLMEIVRETGHRLFGDNCAACHGADARGGKGFPDLTDGSWLWGGAPDTIAETIRVGVNSSHEDTRSSQMPAFGRDQLLDDTQIASVVAFVQSLSDPALAAGAEASAVSAGKGLFADNCAACHGEDGKGSVEAGAPNLTDRFWLYGGDRLSIFTTVFGGRQGHMPTWEARLSPLDRKVLTLYLVDLGRQHR